MLCDLETALPFSLVTVMQLKPISSLGTFAGLVNMTINVYKTQLILMTYTLIKGVATKKMREVYKII